MLKTINCHTCVWVPHFYYRCSVPRVCTLVLFIIVVSYFAIQQYKWSLPTNLVE